VDYVAMDEIKRRQRFVEALRRQDDFHRHAPRPLYGLPPSFKGPRMTGESQWDLRVEVELVHGGDYTTADASSLRVVVVHQEHGDLDTELRELL
jgi:hypothetical protein